MVGDCQFDPDQSASRQEIVILTRLPPCRGVVFLKATRIAGEILCSVGLVRMTLATTFC